MSDTFEFDTTSLSKQDQITFMMLLSQGVKVKVSDGILLELKSQISDLKELCLKEVRDAHKFGFWEAKSVADNREDLSWKKFNGTR